MHTYEITVTRGTRQTVVKIDARSKADALRLVGNAVGSAAPMRVTSQH